MYFEPLLVLFLAFTWTRADVFKLLRVLFLALTWVRVFVSLTLTWVAFSAYVTVFLCILNLYVGFLQP